MLRKSRLDVKRVVDHTPCARIVARYLMINMKYTGWRFEVSEYDVSDDNEYLVDFYFICPRCSAELVDENNIFDEEDIEHLRDSGIDWEIGCRTCQKYYDVHFDGDMEY